MNCRIKPGNDDVENHPRGTPHSSLRGATATKQSSFRRQPTGLLRRSRDACALVIARSDGDEAIRLPAPADWIASLGLPAAGHFGPSVELVMTRKRRRSRDA
jgi:hypothetical protein